ncbi:MAG: hypothetical protein K0R92_2839 [Lachnospiraceae bacterium]|jgi:hypothetical protein|nr:hypothetical protein [Lachnospiraceae bacterium]
MSGCEQSPTIQFQTAFTPLVEHAKKTLTSSSSTKRKCLVGLDWTILDRYGFP